MHAVPVALTEQVTFKDLQYFPVRLAPLTIVQLKLASATSQQLPEPLEPVGSHLHYFLSPRIKLPSHDSLTS